MNDMWDNEYDIKVPKHEIPRFVPPIKIEYIERLCEDMRMSRVEEGGGEVNVKDLDVNGKEMEEKAKEFREDLGKQGGHNIGYAQGT
ncbi:hypothetical protein DID88_004706 [Monilinia fructigena]|uniref:Uncharacterized protein n=1 Tax=Monilinia fructigena TaxID=38457 RepID=A0A395IRA9_9HELO|nr:hypothetical protein DID88_004706 [Monilinia fructigena]